MVLSILLDLMICSRYPPRCFVCWPPGSDDLYSLTVDSHVTHPIAEFGIWITLLHRIHLPHSSSLTGLPEEPPPIQHNTWGLCCLTLYFWISVCITTLHLHTDVCFLRCVHLYVFVHIRSSFFLLVIVTPLPNPTCSSTSWSLALLPVGFNFHLPMKPEEAVD